jgi:hypothetical protein
VTEKQDFWERVHGGRCAYRGSKTWWAGLDFAHGGRPLREITLTIIPAPGPPTDVPVMVEHAKLLICWDCDRFLASEKRRNGWPHLIVVEQP